MEISYSPGHHQFGVTKGMTGIFVGRQIGNWCCESQLGSGSFGIVHVWRNIKTKENIALKKCRFGPEVVISDKHKEQWRQEVDIMLRLDHGNVVKCQPPPKILQNIDGIPDSLPLLCMEYCSGGDLRKVLNSPENTTGLEQNEVLQCIGDLASALGFLHNRRIIHRDLKPENVVLDMKTDRFIYKLIDLGYAKELGQSSMALSFVGTLQYIAPELFLSQQYTKSVDYWSLGFLCFEVATGYRPFLPNFSPAQWIEHVQKKPSNVICIYQSDPETDDIISINELLPQNHLSQSMQTDLSHWLQPLLEWDPNRRGKGPNGDIIIYKELGSILRKVRIQVVNLSCPTPWMDFVPSETTIGNDMKKWISENCKVPIENQLVLLSDGNQLQQNTPIIKQLESLSDIVYVWDSSSQQTLHDLIKHVPLRIPDSIQPYLQSPRKEVSFLKRKQLYSHAHFFMKQEQNVMMNIQIGLSVFAVFIENSIKELNSSSQILSKSYERSLATFELFKTSLHHDLEKYRQQVQKKHHLTSRQMFDSWFHSESILQKEFNCVRAQFINVNEELSKLVNTCKDLQIISKCNESDMRNFVIQSIRKIEDIRKIPIGGRKEKETVIEVPQIIVKALKHRDKFLQDYMTKAIKFGSYYTEIIKLISRQTRVLQGFDLFCHTVSKVQKRRQSDLWKLLSAAVNRTSTTPLPKDDNESKNKLPNQNIDKTIETSTLETQRALAKNSQLSSQLQSMNQEFEAITMKENPPF